MKHAELFVGEEIDVDRIKSEIVDLLMYMKEQGIVEVPTTKVLDKLSDMGIEIADKALVDMLVDMPEVVNTATVQTIVLKAEDMPDAVSDRNQAQDQVAQAAQSANPLT